jgi:hypothetical protein
MGVNFASAQPRPAPAPPPPPPTADDGPCGAATATASAARRALSFAKAANIRLPNWKDFSANDEHSDVLVGFDWAKKASDFCES